MFRIGFDEKRPGSDGLFELASNEEIGAEVRDYLLHDGDETAVAEHIVRRFFTPRCVVMISRNGFVCVRHSQIAEKELENIPPSSWVTTICQPAVDGDTAAAHP